MDQIDYHKFVDDELAKRGLRIQLITEQYMNENIRRLSTFINDGFAEYYDVYHWRKHADDDYLLNPLTDKFKYSFCILNTKNEIKFVDFCSVLDRKLNNHFVFTSKDVRGINLAKYHIIKLSQTGLDNGINEHIGYFSNKNNGSIILFLRMGYEISHIREDGLIIAYANSEKVIANTYKMLTEHK
jgi:hypothetical protein